MSAITPFTKLHTAIWGLFEDDTRFCQLIPPANRVRYDKNDRMPLKNDIAAADLPEFMVVDYGGPINLNHSSSSAKVVRNYSAILNTGDYRINEFTNVLTWLMLCNIDTWQSKLALCKWFDRSFAKVLRITEATTGESVPQRNRKINGFTAVWSLEVECYFQKSHLTFSETEA